ncbi:MAG: flagellar hook-associated protein FlgL [Dehalococcoidia bacterium]
MGIRVSEQSRQEARLRVLQTVTQRADKLQQQIASGRRIERASDDPAGATLALRHRRDIAFEGQMRRNLEGGIAFMNATEAALDAATDALQRARELTVQASSSALSTTDRNAIAKEINQILGHLAQIANGSFGGAYIFSGYQTQTPAYDVAGDPPIAVTYQGDNGQRIRRISLQDEAPVNLTGPEVFGNVFDELITLRNNLNSSVPPDVIATSLDGIDAAIDRVIAGRAEIGSRINRFELSRSQSEVNNIELQKLRADIEEIDLADAVVKLTAQQAALEAALAAIGRTSTMSLLAFLQ